MSQDNNVDKQILESMEFLRSQGFDLSGLGAPKPPENKKKIRLVFYGDAPSVATGFGKVAKNILTYLWNTGDYEIYCFGVNYMGVPHPFPFQIYPMLPNSNMDPYGSEKIMQVLPAMEFDVVFFLQDSFILSFMPELLENMKRMGKQFRSIAYFPIDGAPWREWVEAMSFADMPVTFTKWGAQQCINQFPQIKDRLRIVPHGISTEEFFPQSEEKKKELRQLYFGPHANKFIVINVNRNQQRKDIPRTLAAFKEFKKDCPNSIYYLHCAEVDVGWNLPRVIDNLGMKLGEDVLFPPNFNPNQGYPVNVVNDLYNCADVCISATLGGGWELSSTEALCTKTPCIFPDNSALTEIFSDGRGFLCKSGNTPNFKTILPNDNDVVRSLMDINDMVKYLKRLYQKPEIGQRMAEKGYQWVLENLQWEKNIVPVFDQYIRELYADLQVAPQQMQFVEPQGEVDWRKGEII